MTSSLVGSEMCIRDRQPDAHGGAAQDGLKLELGQAYVSPPATTPEFSHCLLYTSDAADDM
eukprot:11838751-Prorocentrum_lima.AAC.1